MKTGHPARVLIAAAVIVLSVASPVRAQTLDGPLAPEKAAGSFRLMPGLKLELVAAEPMVVSPVALAFDERGRLFVAENRGYPTGPGAGQPPAGRVAMLEDVDGDGRMDRRTEFAEGLTFPNGVMPWKGGVIVTCAPDVLYLRDTDGDGKADERRVLFTGFSTAGSTQLRVSNPTLSVDNWVYLTSGLTGGSVVSPTSPGRPPVELKRTDFRFRPDGDAYEAADGGAQFGMTFDDFGRRFICYNRVQVQHVVISSKTLRRNPNLAFSETVQDCPAETVAEPLKGHGAAARLYPISRNVTTADSHAGTFTAACAVTVFRGTGLPESYRGGAFSCDPTGNLVHFDRLVPNGATFSAVRWGGNTEFLASSDNWFRPVFLAHGPDGALYVADMYRKTIEHPDYLPEEIRKRTDFDGGKTMGRIWRVVRDDANAGDLQKLRNVKLSGASTARLCETLRNPDGWWRDTAHRLLLERRDRDAVGPLKALVTSEQTPPATVVQALYLLAEFDALPDAVMVQGPEGLMAQLARHGAAGVRETVPQLIRRPAPLPAGGYQATLSGGPYPAWPAQELAVGLADDEDARVRFIAAIALGDVGGWDTRAAVALARIAARDGTDRWVRAAVFSSLKARELDFLKALASRPRGPSPLSPELLSEFGRLLGTSRPQERGAVNVALIFEGKPGFTPVEQAALLTGLAEAARGRIGPRDRGKGGVLSALTDNEEKTTGPVRDLIAAMTKLALDPAQPLDRRRTAVGLLAFADFDQAGEALLGLVNTREPVELQTAAVRALGALRDGRVSTALLSAGRFAGYAPGVRNEVMAALISRPEHWPGLLSAVESGQIPVGAIDAQSRRQLMQSQEPDVRKRAAALFGSVPADRAKVYEEYKSVIALKADPVHGRAVFRRECASCHRLDREGFPVGPDLFGIRNQPKEAILLHILVPDQEITQGYASYTVATRDGRVLTGLIASETPTGITLRQPLGKEDTLLRAEIDEISAGKQSLMPQGLEKSISRQEFADLLAYLKGEAGPATQE